MANAWLSVSFFLVCLVWFVQTTFVIFLVAQVGGADFSRFLSRWYYVVVALLYTAWVFSFSNGTMRRFSHSLLFFYHGAVWVWTLLTFGLVLSGAPLLFEDDSFTLDSGTSALLVGGIFAAHFSPIIIIVIYALAFRRSLAVFHYATYETSVHRFGLALTAAAVAFVCVALPLAPTAVYVIFFDPFVVYKVERNAAPWLLVTMIVIVLMVALQLALMSWLYTGLSPGASGPRASSFASWQEAQYRKEQQQQQQQKKKKKKQQWKQQARPSSHRGT